jgi:tRNA-specific adenosine deaminase 2
MCDRDEIFMREALKEAEKSMNSGEIPVGCVFVHKDSDEILARGANNTNESRNGTMHAEIVAMTKALSSSSGVSADIFKGSELFVTCEPCIMCAGALAKAGVKRIIFGCHNDRFGGNGSILSLQNNPNLFSHSSIGPYEITSGVLQEEAIAVFQKFYTSENRRAPEAKRKRKREKGTAEKDDLED